MHRFPVAEWRPELFLLGGAGVVTHACLMAVRAFTGLPTPPDVFVTAGHLVGLLGLVGLYPALVDRQPRTARVALVVGSVAVGCWVVMNVGQALAVAGVWSSLSAGLPGAFFLLVLGSSILAYGLFGVAVLRVEDGSRAVGLLVLAPAVLLAVLVVDGAVGEVTAADGVVIGGGLALSMVALGVRLRTWQPTGARGATTLDAAAG